MIMELWFKVPVRGEAIMNSPHTLASNPPIALSHLQAVGFKKSNASLHPKIKRILNDPAGCYVGLYPSEADRLLPLERCVVSNNSIRVR